MSMFGAVCSGRPMELARQVEPTKWVFSIENASNVNHIAVFILPQTQFTDVNYTALVYFQLPNSAEFKLLGGLNPARPLAIFRLNNTTVKSTESHFADDDDAMNDDSGPPADYVLNIGIAIEPTPQAEALIAQEKSKQKTILPVPPSAQPAPQQPLEIAGLANKIVKHAYNYLGSFIDASGKVPMKAFDNWWDKFRTKLANNPNFLNELD